MAIKSCTILNLIFLFKFELKSKTYYLFSALYGMAGMYGGGYGFPPAPSTTSSPLPPTSTLGVAASQAQSLGLNSASNNLHEYLHTVTSKHFWFFVFRTTKKSKITIFYRYSFQINATEISFTPDFFFLQILLINMLVLCKYRNYNDFRFFFTLVLTGTVW